MLFEGCQGKKDVQFEERVCPNCGHTVEITSADLYAACDNCGCTVYSDRADCVRHCAKARECLGEERYRRLMEAREKLQGQMEAFQDDDQW